MNGPGVDVIGVHIVFAERWRRVRDGLFRDLRTGPNRARALHRIAYYRLLRTLERRAYSGPVSLWAASRADARILEAEFGIPAGTVAVVPHGVDAEAFSPAARASRRAVARSELGMGDERVVLLIGNDVHAKGIDVAVQALVELPEDVVLAVAGGADASSIERLAARNGSGHRVRRWGHTDDILRYHAAADVLVAPSREDAFNLPVLEAMACGLPVIVSERAGVSELLTDGDEAIVLPAPVDPGALAASIRTVLDDGELARRLTERGRALAERCTWDENAARTAEIIEREISTPRCVVLGVDPGGVGGIQRATRELLRALADVLGEERVGVVSVWRDGHHPFRGRVLHAGRPATPSSRPTLLHKATYAAAAVATIGRWRRRLVVVAAHPHLSPAAMIGRAIAGAPYVVWCHGIESWRRPSLLVREALRRADVVLAPSAFTARRVEAVAGLSAGSVRVVPHCVPEDALETRERAVEPGSRDGVARILTVARLSQANRYKGVDTLLYALPLIRPRVPVELLVIGDGTDRERLVRVAELLDLDGSVRFAGSVTDDELARAYGEADVFALPARTRLEPTPEGEGFGLVYIEAGAAGLPVVAGRGGGSEAVVLDGVNGLLVDPSDVRSVADAIVRLVEEPELARRLGEGGRRLASERFSYERFRDDVARVLLDAGPRGLVALDRSSGPG